MSLPRAEAEIDRGFAAVDQALYGSGGRVPQTPFFRFPGFASNAALLALLAKRAASPCSAPICGRATGIRCRRNTSARWCCNG